MIMIYSNTTSAYTYVFSPDDIPPDAIIDWGDGSIEILNQNSNILNHFYTSSGTYTVTIRGYLPKIQGGSVGFGFTPPPGTSGLTAVTEWNSTTVSLRAAFEGRNALISVPNYLPPLVTDIDFMFLDAASINDPNIAFWDVSNVTNMFGTFYNSLGFNQDLSNWCVSSFPSEPAQFSEGASSWTQPKPVWGTCPAEFSFSGYAELNDPNFDDTIFLESVSGSADNMLAALSTLSINDTFEWTSPYNPNPTQRYTATLLSGNVGVGSSWRFQVSTVPRPDGDGTFYRAYWVDKIFLPSP
jgi:hypothetical protein